MKRVRAKFYVHDIHHHHIETPDDECCVTIKMSPVFESMPNRDGNTCEENKIFGKWSPSGSLEMQIRNPEAAQQFELGKSYYIDFTPADD